MENKKECMFWGEISFGDNTFEKICFAKNPYCRYDCKMKNNLIKEKNGVSVEDRLLNLTNDIDGITNKFDELTTDFKYLGDFLLDLFEDSPNHKFFDDPINKEKVKQCKVICKKYWEN